MTTFHSLHEGRVHLHLLSTEQFRTRHVSVKVAVRAERKTVTATAMLPFLWMEGSQRYTSSHALMQRADELFGTVLRSSISKRGSQQICELYAAVPEEAGIAIAEGVFEEAQNLVLDVLMHPYVQNNQFPDNHVAREQQLHTKRIESVYDDKAAFAMERCIANVSRGHDAMVLPRFGFKDDVSTLTGASLFKRNEEIIHAAEVHVYMIGNISTDEAKHYLEQLCDSFPQRERKFSMGIERALPIVERDVNYIEDHQSVQQGKLNLGYRTNVSYADDTYPAMQMAVAILGGFPHSKLFVNVREKESLAYYASSRLDGISGITTIQTGIEIDKYDKALEIILKQVEAMKVGEITESEFTFTKRGLLNQFKQALDQPMSMADVHFTGVLTGTYRDIPGLMERLEQVKLDDVVQAANQLMLDTVYFLRDEVQTHA